ncbi:polysaccharide biosynthesis tyrosine autokinase [Maribacter sp. 1_MG-2023]|uniref:GumC family protein n=1 Tax=Maribacter sp. 1_MG-2023 TaxID=3062677 RepID=UPI0026E3F48D|nr:polysaccharide biosynthesis tyrosine autokinase [Maribacter sp. 1_MG-2023]MDO6470706.1 polysaccharide biosynthesis tyrosine autokinase [Maribacter sp. 1_MG-2023]
MSKENYDLYSEESEGIEFKAILDRYLRYWPWFAIGVGVCLFLSVVYLSISKSTYKAVATIIIDDEKSKSSSVGSAFSDLSLLSGLSTSSIENELGLLRSKRLMHNTVRALDLNVHYKEANGILKKEYYMNSPYIIRIASLDSDLLNKAMKLEVNKFTINYIGEKDVEIKIENSDTIITNKIGEIVDLEFIKFFVEPNENMDFSVDDDGKFKSVLVLISGVEGTASSLNSNLNVSLVNKNSTMIQLGLTNEFPTKAKNVLNQLIFEYNQEAIEDKDLIARNTAFFIDERLAIINSELDSVETGKEQFKESNLLTNIETESQLIVQNVSDYKNEQQRIGTELELTNALIKHLRNNKTSLLPANIGIEDSGLGGLIEEFNSIVLERNRLLKSASNQNPVVVGLNNQIDQIRDNVMASLIGMRSSLNIKKNNLDRQSGVLASQISDVPAQERAYRGIERQQNIKEALYLFLLQKREENSLSLAASAPKAKIVDEAYSLGGPISPRPKLILLGGLFLGLVFPFLIINAISLLNDKLQNSEDVKKEAKDLTLLSELPHILPQQTAVVEPNIRTVLSESFNILASNVQHMLENTLSEETSKCIFVTSSLKGEGKTFTSVNLGITLASEGNKVIVIGGDLRNPQLQRYQKNADHLNGLSTYLNDTSLIVQDYIKDTDLHSNLKFMYTGAIPANPSQLLKSLKMRQMFDELKKDFDYVIIDTAPVLQVADTYIINKYADVTLYLLRASVTKKNFVGLVEEMVKSKKLKNVGLVLNDVKLKDSSYGYGYDYGS